MFGGSQACSGSANLLKKNNKKVVAICCLQKVFISMQFLKIFRSGSRISGKGVHMYKGVGGGGSLC